MVKKSATCMYQADHLQTLYMYQVDWRQLAIMILTILGLRKEDHSPNHFLVNSFKSCTMKVSSCMFTVFHVIFHVTTQCGPQFLNFYIKFLSLILILGMHSITKVNI